MSQPRSLGIVFFFFVALSLSSVDLEQVCLSRLELAQIASQRHHAVTSGNIVYACMRALEDAAILNELDLEKRYYISLIDTD